MFLLGESHGQRSLVGYSPWGHKDSDTAEHLTTFSIRPRRPVKRPEKRAEPQDRPKARAQRLQCLSCVLRRVYSHMRTSRSPGIYQNLLKPLWTPPIPRFPFWGFFFFFFCLPFGHWLFICVFPKCFWYIPLWKALGARQALNQVIKAATAQGVSSTKPPGVSSNEILWARSCEGTLTPWCPLHGSEAPGPQCDEFSVSQATAEPQTGSGREYMTMPQRRADFTETGLFILSKVSQNCCKPFVDFSKLILTLFCQFPWCFYGGENSKPPKEKLNYALCCLISFSPARMWSPWNGASLLFKTALPGQTNMTWTKQGSHKYFSVDKWVDEWKGSLPIMKHMDCDLSTWLPFHSFAFSLQPITSTP